jgi:hypothetical protein
MSKLRFDPTTYQFYFTSAPGDSRAKAAGFRWDPLRCRYYTNEPSVAKSMSDCGDRYAKQLLADVLGVTIVTEIHSGARPTTAPH